MSLRAPFPYYGSKRKAAEVIEQLHGDVNNLVIPFAGSLGELLGRTRPAPVETVNDLDGFVVNAWRAMVSAPDQLAELCDHPVHEVTMHAAHDLLLARAEDLRDLLRWVRITIGEWTRVVTPSVTTSHGLTGVSLDPPYEHEGRSTRLYREDDASLSGNARAWAIERGPDPLLRISLCGRGEEHDETLEHGWTKHVWRERQGDDLGVTELLQQRRRQRAALRMTRNTSARGTVRPSMNERLERAVAMAAEFLREAREDLHFAAILASETDQPRRAGSLSRASSKAKDLAGELIGAWVAARKSEPKATKLVGATLEPGATLHAGQRLAELWGALGFREGRAGSWAEAIDMVRLNVDLVENPEAPRGGEQVSGLSPPHESEGAMDESGGKRVSKFVYQISRSNVPVEREIGGTTSVTIHRGSTLLQMPAATPPEVVDVLFSIAMPLDLDESAVWPIESLAREVRELASDAGHNDEVARAKVSIADVCRALGIDAWIHERDHGDDVARPATREEIITKLEGIRAATQVSLQATVSATRAFARQLEVVEDGLAQRLAEHIAEIDPDWLAALVRESS